MSQPPQPSADPLEELHAPEPEKPPKFTEEIDGLLASLSEHPISLRELLTVMKGRAYTLLLIFLAMPFCLPIPLPGLSTVFGAVIALIGLRLSLRQEPWLPERMLNTTIAPKILRNILLATRKLSRVFELLLRPRLVGLVEWTLLHHLNGAMICISGLLLLLPLPVPFSNILPAITIILLAAAMLERDGLLVIFGIIAFVANCFFFAGIFAIGAKAVLWLRDWVREAGWSHWFQPEVPIPPNLPADGPLIEPLLDPAAP